MTESETVVAQKLAEERAGLLRKVEKKKKTIEAKTQWLVEERETMETGKKKAEEKAEQLKQELQELQVGFVVQKEESNAEYHK